jgi:FMN phosphatase YigB (HAD superfamily)
MCLLSRQPRTLLITLDAFGTLYRPRKDIATQYLDVAASCGLDLDLDANTEAFSRSFHQALRTQYSRSPNYGKATTGMTAQKWWANVVRDTFGPLLGLRQAVPGTLPDSLFRHFATEKAYELYPDTTPFFQHMQKWKQRLSPDLGVLNVVVGVLTNSDPRVAAVLSSLGLAVGGAGQQLQQRRQDVRKKDLDFVLTSYEAGHEKPSPKLFEEAEQVARATLGLPRLGERSSGDMGWNAVKVHVGDDLRRDYYGALGSGRIWDALHLNRKDDRIESPDHNAKQITKLTDTPAVLMALLQQSRR